MLKKTKILKSLIELMYPKQTEFVNSSNNQKFLSSKLGEPVPSTKS